MKRGDLVTVAVPGDFGKPRPALIVQSDLFEEVPTVTFLLISSDLQNAPLLRITLEPTASNGLRKVSQVMIDKMMTLRRDRIGEPFGTLTNADMVSISRAMAVFLGFA